MSFFRSFVDLATLAVHRRHEMEARIDEFMKKCDTAIQNVLNLQMKSQSFVDQLKCEPSELKERFLNCMKHLDEYTYIITDFNLALEKLDETTNVDYTPVQGTKNQAILPPSPGTFNLIDALSEPIPSTSNACPNHCLTEKPIRKKIPKEDQQLIVFSSTSNSSESVQRKSDTVEREVQCTIPDGAENVVIEDVSHTEAYSPKPCNLPAQTVATVDYVYTATIMHVDGTSFWVITDNVDEVYNLLTDMTNYYKNNQVEMNLDQVMGLTYCAYYDEESDCYYRGLFIRLTEEDMSIAELFLVDTGEVRLVAVTSIQPLVPAYCDKPPYARCCHLAGVDLISVQDNDLLEKQEEFMRAYIGTLCSIEIDDNTSESLGVYVILPSGETLNDLMVKQGLAIAVDKKQPSEMKTTYIPPSSARSGSDDSLDITQGPEHEDALEAVTGYHNRDEANICKHYKGGPEKTCFKGSRCTKKHVLMHPDGWTLDQVPVVGKYRSLPLPAPDTWLRMHVTHVAHFDRFYGHIVTDKKKETVPSFGVVLPPTTLESLVRDMNSLATRTSYKKLKIIPAPGELVAALYPLDGQWYRARVISVTRADQNVEVQYIDYGNSVWIKEDEVCELPARHAALPAQALRCALAGVRARSLASSHWAAARNTLVQLLSDRVVTVHVIARDYDEITVEVFDDGYNVAEHLVAGSEQLELTEYAVINDSAFTKRIVVP